MLDRELPASQKSLEVVPKNVPVVLAEGDGHALALILPPLEDMAEIGTIRSRLFSLKEHAELSSLRERYRSELNELKREERRFSGSATYFNRVANLAFVIGDHEEEGRNLLRARDLSADSFFVQRLAENLISRDRSKEAETLFGSLDLERDLHANLRLAFFYVQRNDLPNAEERIEQALRIDPLDFAARLFEGGLLLANGQYQRAIASFRVAEDSRQTATLHTNKALAFVRLNLAEKGFTALKRAIALDPLHVNANTILADLAFREGKNEEALPSLRYFVQFEQTDAEIWSRLARACFHVGLIDETIAALMRQASLGESCAIWNNLGVCYQYQKNQKRAREAFKQAMKLGQEGLARDYFMAARNLIQSFATSGSEWREAAEITGAVIREDKDEVCLRDDVLSDIYTFNLWVLISSGRAARAREISEELLAIPTTAARLKMWLVNSLIIYYVFYDDGKRSEELIKEYEGMMETRTAPRELERRAWFYNNSAFTFAERGDLATAERYLSKISDQIHRMPYPTATLGLIHFRKGHEERATKLYWEAVGLAQTEHDKARIRQKLYLERGRYLLSHHREREAQRSFERVIDTDNGEAALADAARMSLRRLESGSG